jgi:hypothetical protein
MICDYSLRLPEDTFRIKQLVGDAFSLVDKLKMGGNGSPRFIIEKASEQLANKLSAFDVTNYSNIELRPNGIIIHFKNNLVHYIWAIPYYKLSLYNTDYQSFHADGEYISFNKAVLEQKHITFLGRLQNLRLKYLATHFSAGPNPI